jgi:hypothetical protein
MPPVVDKSCLWRRIDHRRGSSTGNALPNGFQLCEENNMMLERILLIGVLFAACLSAHAADRKFIVKPRPQGLAALPLSDGVLVGKTLYRSDDGQAAQEAHSLRCRSSSR